MDINTVLPSLSLTGQKESSTGGGSKITGMHHRQVGVSTTRPGQCIICPFFFFWIGTFFTISLPVSRWNVFQIVLEI